MSSEQSLPRMDVGVSLTFQNLGRQRTDRQVWEQELRLASLAEPLGFDSVWTTEHHFTDYMLIPDPLQFLTWVASRTERVKLGSMVVVLPWHDPLRVAENVVVLDHMSQGRVILGLGRGAAKVEFEGFGKSMDVSREQFVEGAELLLSALESGVAEYDGVYIKQARRELRPGPFASFRGRAFAGTLSPEAAPIMAKLGLGIMVIPQKPWAQVADELSDYAQVYRELHAAVPPSPIAAAWVYCDADGERAREMAYRYAGHYYKSTIEHYRFDSDELANARGYDYYKRIRDSLAKTGNDKAALAFTDAQVWGTPEQCIEKARDIQRRIGCTGFNAVFAYGGMPHEQAEASMRLFAREAMPALQRSA
jgi:alkanesulfonate monooxygenase SsuD/methylene tetrahydromethanopterin reductase-like flavin-dependent oxidoreductase (luciferase family)